MPAPGSLNTLATIERRTALADEILGTPAEWSEVTKCWCEMKPLGGDETEEADQQQGQTRYELRTHWTLALGGVTAADRLTLSDGRTLQIFSVLNVNEMNREALITAVYRNPATTAA